MSSSVRDVSFLESLNFTFDFGLLEAVSVAVLTPLRDDILRASNLSETFEPN